jgi:hypothetical protein
MTQSDGLKALPPEGKGAPGASRNDFPTHAGGLGPHRAHAATNLLVGPGTPPGSETPTNMLPLLMMSYLTCLNNTLKSLESPKLNMIS